MSQSPTEQVGAQTSDAIRYRQGWSALNRLLHEDKSFSGREKHCVFLNCGGTSFVDISGLTGLNFPEDGRAVISCDWDFDGDLDLWVASRTAPRLRFLKNTHQNASPNFMSFWLEGDGIRTNRDAVGARVDLYFRGNPIPMSRRVTAGDSFLSQNSHWVHFHWSDPDVPERLVVHWPGGGSQEVQAPGPGRFYFWTQNQLPKPRSVPTPQADLMTQPQPVPPTSASARIVVTGRLPLPPILAHTESGDIEVPPDKLQGPLLINIWATWCGPCISELKAWTQNASAIRKSGLRILTLQSEPSQAPGAHKLLSGLKFPFESMDLSSVSLVHLDLFQRAYMDRWLPMPVPTSFLIDRNGEVAVIYKGPVDWDVLLKDLQLLDLNLADRRAAAVPFPGLWHAPPREASPMWVNAQFVAHNQVLDGINYLRRFVSLKATSRSLPPQTLASLYSSIGTLEMHEGLPDRAVQSFLSAIQWYPQDQASRKSLAQLYIQSNDSSKIPEALKLLVEVNRQNPGDREARELFAQGMIRRATHFLRAGQVAEAVQTYKETIRSVPTAVEAAERLAWVLAVHPDAAYRNPADALGVATHLCQISSSQNPAYLELLSVARAVNGDFPGAITAAQMAQAIYTRSNQLDQLVLTNQRMELFRAGQIPQFTPFDE